MPEEFILKDESKLINGSAMEVHNILGRGHSEQIYCDALEIEFGLRGIPNQREIHFPVIYKNILLKRHFQADFVVFEKVIVEVKAIDQLTSGNYRQAINYLASSKLK
jgi:GxxExxY protein